MIHRLLRHWPFVMRLPGYAPGETQCFCERCGAMWLERRWVTNPRARALGLSILAVTAALVGLGILVAWQ